MAPNVKKMRTLAICHILITIMTKTLGYDLPNTKLEYLQQTNLLAYEGKAFYYK